MPVFKKLFKINKIGTHRHADFLLFQLRLTLKPLISHNFWPLLKVTWLLKSYMGIQESHTNFTETDRVTKGFPLLAGGDI